MIRYLAKRVSNSAFKKQSSHGFTLIEILVVTIVIGILTGITVPSLFKQVNRAKEVEAITSTEILQKNQQIFYLENGDFSENLEELGLSTNETSNYQLLIVSEPTLNGVLHLALSKRVGLRSYASVVYLEGSQVFECDAFPVDISLEDSSLTIFLLIQEVYENPNQYCS